MSAIVAAVRASDDRRAFVFALDTTDDPKRVAHWGWLRRTAQGYSEPGLLHPAVGTAIYVREWSYGSCNPQSGGYVTTEKYDPVLIVRLSDGRTFADQWANSTVLYDALSRWRNASGCLVDWELSPGISVPTCAIGGLDWKTIPAALDERHARVLRESKLSEERG